MLCIKKAKVLKYIHKSYWKEGPYLRKKNEKFENQV